jgi:hypothetical protein
MTDSPTRCAWCGTPYGAFLSLLTHIDDEHLVMPRNVVSMAEARQARHQRRIGAYQQMLPTPA